MRVTLHYVGGPKDGTVGEVELSTEDKGRIIIRKVASTGKRGYRYLYRSVLWNGDSELKLAYNGLLRSRF